MVLLRTIVGFNLHDHVLMNTTQERWRGRAKAVGWIIGGTTVGLCALVTPFILPALRKHCLPYVPATAQQLPLVVQHAKGHTLVDIGSGDGRVVVEAAKAGYDAVGYELNPWLVVYSKLNSWYHGVYGKTSFHCKDIWKVNFSSFDTIVIFGVTDMMEPLGRKLLQEISSHPTRIIACRFPFPQLKPTIAMDHGPSSVWVYDIIVDNKNFSSSMKV